MKQRFAHQFLSLSLAAGLTMGLLSALGSVADQQHRSAAAQLASQSVQQPAAAGTAPLAAAAPAQRRS